MDGKKFRGMLLKAGGRDFSVLFQLGGVAGLLPGDDGVSGHSLPPPMSL
jgi:hypothetical protein